MKESGEFKFDWPILGHENIKHYLQKLIISQNFCHTYLFAGPQDIGKKTLAHYFGQSIFCQNHKNIEKDNKRFPCQDCVNCQEINKGIHPDLMIFDLKDDKKNISIEQVREFKEKFYLTPIKSKYKIAIINNADFLSIEAANALLKVIEEPPRNSIVILIAQEVKNILPTIISRSQIIKFANVPLKDVSKYLHSKDIDSKLVEELTFFSGGIPGIALFYGKNVDLWEKHKVELNRIVEIIDNPLNDKFKWVEGQIKKSKNSKNSYIYLETLLNSYLRISRDLLIFKLDSEINLIHPFLKEVIEKVSQKYSTKKLLNFYHQALESKIMLLQ
ncbi:hypothetical protein K8R66_00260, partial [bacterium]|nr:hypothetical protein [bacterium]